MIKEHSIGEDLQTIRRLIRVALVVVLVIGTFFYWSTSTQTNDLAKVVDEIVAVRTNARERECARDNAQLDKAIRRVRTSWLEFIRHSTGGVPLPPEQQAKVEPFLADQEAAVREEFSDRAPRSCTPAAIDAYYGGGTR